MRKKLLELINYNLSNAACLLIKLTNITPQTINTRDTCKKMLLHAAIEKGSLPAINLLIKCGADVNLLSTDEENLTPLMLATKLASYTITNLLLSKGADVNLINNKGLKASDYAPNNDTLLQNLLSANRILVGEDSNNGLEEEELDDTVEMSGSSEI